MIGLDTNVLVRLLTADEPAQLKKATQLLAARDGEQAAFFINDMVLVELVWVLRKLFGADREAALSAIKSLLANDAFAFEDRERLARAVSCCDGRALDFADAMVALKSAEAGCEYMASFVKAMKDLPGVRLL